MKQHRYRVILEHLQDANGLASTQKPLQFDVGNHDDIMAIVQRLADRDDFPKGYAAPMGVGLKLFSEVMLENRKHPLFESFMPHFAQFMKDLKKGPGSA